MDSDFLGARYSADKTSVIFRVVAPNATRIELWVYATPTDSTAIATIVLVSNSNGIFAGSIDVAVLQQAGLVDDIYYGYRAWGSNWAFDPAWQPGSINGFFADVDANGNRFNPNKLLLDPYALEVSHNPLTPAQPDPSVYLSGPQFRTVDTGPFAPKGIVISIPEISFGLKPVRPFKDEIIYEVHVRGLTMNDPTVPVNLRGTYAGAALRAGYLRDLGITAVEFLPIHETENSLNDLPQFESQHNYWGYNSISYFAPDRRYASNRSPGGPTREFISMVKAFHDAGLKVYLDVVYNHHDEGDVDSATGTIGKVYTLRGLSNLDYYEPSGNPARPNTYQDNNGVGPNINAAAPLARNLVLDSLAYWTKVMGADGFRFDLAAVLGNADRFGGFAFDATDPNNILNRAVAELPARPANGGAGVDLIAEPYTADGQPAGQDQGDFPVGWAEWNDRYRDVFRKSQNKLGIIPVTPGEMATRFAGSSDLFQPSGRRPWNSVNYLVSHDGFTLKDLYSFSTKRNNQPFPFGPSPGGRSADDEFCWNHGGDPVQQRQAVLTGLGILMVSAGVPMITGGTEFDRTQFGNNNPFNLDTVANWLDWQLEQQESALLVAFSAALFKFRLSHPALRPANFFTGQDNNGNGLKDLTWYQDDGSEVVGSYFGDANNHFLAFRIDGTEFGDPAVSLYIAYNGWINPVVATLPAPLSGNHWFEVANTSASAASFGNIHQPGTEPQITATTYSVDGRSLIILLEAP